MRPSCLCRLRELKALIASRCLPVCVKIATLQGFRNIERLTLNSTTSATTATWIAQRVCTAASNTASYSHNRTAASLPVDNEKKHQLDAASASPSSRPQQNADTEELVRTLRQADEFRSRLVNHFVRLPLDRRVLYRDHLLQDSLTLLQKPLRQLFLDLYHHATNSSEEDSRLPPLTSVVLRDLKSRWLSLKGLPSTQPTDTIRKTAYFDAIRAFYASLLCSGLVTREAHVRRILNELQTCDLLEPSASFYESLFICLWSLADVQRVFTASSENSNSTSATAAAATAGTQTDKATTPTRDLVAGEERQLRRGFVGDLACHYMGHALAQQQQQQHVAVRRETWELFFCTFANAQPAPKLMDLWWGRFIEWVDAQTSVETLEANVAENTATIDDGSMSSLSEKQAPLPYQAVHAVLAWCAQSRDMERALKYFNMVNHRGVTLHADTSPHPSLLLSLAQQFRRPGSLTAKVANVAAQQLQLALLVKLMASTKSVKVDGGLRALVVRDVQQQIDPAVLYAAPWGVLNDLLSGLSVPSAMQLLRRCSLSASSRAEYKGRQCGDLVPSKAKEEERMTENGKRREIPFYIWASLLRRCCREHLQDQAESLFVFLRHKFHLSTVEKRELIEIMMRMYVTMQPADFPSALDLFLQHVLLTPSNEPVVQPDSVLYELLIKGADSRNASMMLFLEACANGVPLTAELFEALMGATQLKTVASLSRKLPRDYAASSLDAQLKIPAEADAHLRREEALRARGKPLYDSTGDAG